MTYKVTCKRGKNVTTADRELVLKMVKRCMAELNKPKHEIGFDIQKSFWKPLHVVVKKKSQCSYACEDESISIDVADYHRGGTFLNEYAAYSSDPVIGERKQAATPESVLFATVAHEVAHHVQFAYGPFTRMYKSTFRKAHGQAFQDIYRILRSTLVNPELDAPAIRLCTEAQAKVDLLRSIYKVNLKSYKAKNRAYKKGLYNSREEETNYLLWESSKVMYDEVLALHSVVVKSYKELQDSQIYAAK